MCTQVGRSDQHQTAAPPYLTESLATSLQQIAGVVTDDHPLQIGRHLGDLQQEINFSAT